MAVCLLELYPGGVKNIIDFNSNTRAGLQFLLRLQSNVRHKWRQSALSPAPQAKNRFARADAGAAQEIESHYGESANRRQFPGLVISRLSLYLSVSGARCSFVLR